MGCEEGELEEGEAGFGGGAVYGYGGSGAVEVVDPDAHSYIDEKLQYLLGCFQKKFEGEISAENLGPQYGGYGSFLPTYPHSPLVLPQSRSPAVPPHHASASRSPYTPMETAQKNHFVKTAFDDSRSNDHYQIYTESNDNPSQQMLKKALNCPEQEPKLCIKVNNNRSLARNTADIYSGLGLDISPSSSVEGSPDGSAGVPMPDVLPDESPRTIFQVMTCYSVPGGLLLSPLAENALNLREKSKVVMEKHEAPELHDVKAEWHREWTHITSANLSDREHMTKEKSDEKKDNIYGFKCPKHRLQNSFILHSRTIKTEHSVESATLTSEISDQLKGTKSFALKGHIIDKNKEYKKEPPLDHLFSDKTKYDSYEYNYRSSTSSSHLQNTPNETTSLERDEKTVSVKAEQCHYKSKDMGSLPSAKSMDIATENADQNSSGMIKLNEKETSQAALSRKKIRIKVNKQLNRTRESYGADENRALDKIDLANAYRRDKKLKPEIDTITSEETDNKSCGGNSVEHKIKSSFMDKSDPSSVSMNENAELSTALTAPAHVVINEEWVGCDKCEKWRLLPYGMNPDILPKKWQCNMQNWLPGMNSCKISEDDTTRAVRALYMVPAPDNSLDGCHDNAVSGIGTATAPTFEGNIQSTSTPGKLKVCHDGVNMKNTLDLNDISKPSKKLHAHSSRNSDGVDCSPKLGEKRKHIESSRKGENVAKYRTPPTRSSVGFVHDNLRPSKKIKKEFNGPVTDQSSEFVISKISPSVNETPKNIHKHIGNSPGMGKYGSSSLGKHYHREDKYFSDEVVKTSGTVKSDVPDLSAKKKNPKQRLQCDLDPLPSNTTAKCITKRSATNVVKEKPRSELKFPKADRSVAHDRGGVTEVDNVNMCVEKVYFEKHQENNHFQQSLPSESFTRRISCNTDTAAVTSSSYKVSNSHKDRADFQETRASPVDSISSSPLIISNKNILDRHQRHSLATTEDVHSQKLRNKSLAHSKGKYDVGSDSRKAMARVSNCFNGDVDHHNVVKDGDLCKDDRDLENAGLNKKGSVLGAKNGQLNPAKEQKVSGKVKSDKGNIQCEDLKIKPSTVKGSKQHPYLNNAGNGDATCKTKQREKAVVENLETRKQVTLGEGASNPINTSVLLKEARDLKHLSKRLKEKGDDFESTNMCFEAALKFLHVASLWEAPSTDSSKQVDPIQAMKLFSETGNLCGFCGHEFERLKKMANASLAYKCVEVAYMKSAFFKHPGAIKDRHAMQTSFLMAPPAESPSSSVSDVDNLNNQSTASKTISRNNHHMMGLLAYADDVNNAFEGTRKSQNSFSAYLSGIGKNQAVGGPLVREVLDFSFLNVKVLLQLIRRSLESINHESVNNRSTDILPINKDI